MWLEGNACRTAPATPTSVCIIPRSGPMKSDERHDFRVTIVLSEPDGKPSGSREKAP